MLSHYRPVQHRAVHLRGAFNDCSRSEHTYAPRQVQRLVWTACQSSSSTTLARPRSRLKERKSVRVWPKTTGTQGAFLGKARGSRDQFDIGRQAAVHTALSPKEASHPGVGPSSRSVTNGDLLPFPHPEGLGHDEGERPTPHLSVECGTALTEPPTKTTSARHNCRDGPQGCGCKLRCGRARAPDE